MGPYTNPGVHVHAILLLAPPLRNPAEIFVGLEYFENLPSVDVFDLSGAPVIDTLSNIMGPTTMKVSF